MPREGIFAEVLKGGVVQKGESIKVIEKEEGPYRVCIITVSDRASKGEYEDKSGPVIKELVEAAGMEVVDYIIVPDEKGQIAKKLLYRWIWYLPQVVQDFQKEMSLRKQQSRLWKEKYPV